MAEGTGQEFDPVATRRAWEEMDVDGDGEVSVHEYVTMQMKHVAPADYEKMVSAASCPLLPRILQVVSLTLPWMLLGFCWVCT